MKRLHKWIVWATTLFVTLLASGCETPPARYCAAAQAPFQWRSDAEIDATPIRVIRYIETDALIWEANKCPTGASTL